MDEYIIMPNHIHGIIIIDKYQNNISVETQDITSLQQKIYNKKTREKQKENLASIIRGFKTGVKK